MNVKILAALRVLGGDATVADVWEASRELFMRSDAYAHASPQFDTSEVDAVARAICEYIDDPDAAESRYIDLNGVRSIRGEKIRCCAFAEIESGDMLYQNMSSDFAVLNLQDLRRALQRYFIGILFRYQFCVYVDTAAFPVSVLLNYIDGVKLLMSREGREREFCDGLLKTLEALRSLEPSQRGG